MKQKNVILMVVAVGCGLVAAFLTSQMSAKPIDQVDVVVAAKDLPVGTMMTREDLKDVVKVVKRPKEGLPPTAVFNPEDLVDKRLSRPIRAEETISSQDLSKGAVITLPDGYDMVSLPVNAAQSAAGFVGPGSRVNVLATVRLHHEVRAFPLLVNMLVVAVDNNVAYAKDSNGTFPTMSTVSFAVKGKEALLLSLAKSRGCNLELMLRNPTKSAEDDKKYNIDEVIKLLSDDRDQSNVKGAVTNPEEKQPEEKQPEVKKEEPKPEVKPEVAPPPAVPMVKVLVAKGDIAPNTEITKDLIAEAFEEKSLPKEFAGSALGDLTEATGQFLKTGVSKGQWVTPGMVGLQGSKTTPPREFYEPKPPAAAPASPKPAPQPVAKRKTHDVTIHTVNGTIVVRYEEVAPGKWKKVAEMNGDQAAREEADAPKGPPEGKRVD